MCARSSPLAEGVAVSAHKNRVSYSTTVATFVSSSVQAPFHGKPKKSATTPEAGRSGKHCFPASKKPTNIARDATTVSYGSTARKKSRENACLLGTQIGPRGPFASSTLLLQHKTLHLEACMRLQPLALGACRAYDGGNA